MLVSVPVTSIVIRLLKVKYQDPKMMLNYLQPFLLLGSSVKRRNYINKGNLKKDYIQIIIAIILFLYFFSYKSVWKKSPFGKGGDKTRWLNSPNVYQKVEVLETGTPDPKKITKVEIIKFENN